MVIEVDKTDFTDLILQKAEACVVEVYTDHCSNCRALDPLFEKAEVEVGEKYGFYKLKANDNLDLVKKYKVLAVPSLLFFIHGKLVEKKLEL